MKKIAVFACSLFLLGGVVGAATGIKISAELKPQNVISNGETYNQQVISYKGSTYVPLRSFGDLVGVSVDYKDGNIYLGGDLSSPATSQTVNTNKSKYKFTIGDGSIEKSAYGDDLIAVIDMTFENNSGETISPYGTLYSINAYQNGVQIDSTVNLGSEYNDVMTEVLNGHTLDFKAMFYIKDDSPVTVEISEFLGDYKQSKVVDIK